jgi:glycosyltransferase involved in cell wall biosynthesis
MTVYVRCNDISSDPRLMKYVSFVVNTKLSYWLVGWNREVNHVDSSNAFYLNVKAKFGEGGIRAIFKRLVWMIFVFRSLFKLRSDVKIVHACDLDAAFPVVIYKIFVDRQLKVVFDVFDWYSDTLYDSGWFVLKAFKWMESLSSKYSDHIIVCEDFRRAQLPQRYVHKSVVLPNVPDFQNGEFLFKDNSLEFSSKKITVSYVGGFYNGRCLDSLLDIAESGFCNLLIAGFGIEEIESRCIRMSALENVKYFGKVSYLRGLQIMFNSDIIYAMYSKSNPNHLFAAPNKLYESLFLGRPILSTNGILISKKIKALNIGVCVDESMEEILDSILSLNEVQLNVFAQNASRLWILEYKGFVNNFLENIYFKQMLAP